MKRLFVILLLIICVLAACDREPHRSESIETEYVCCAWVPYWDADEALKEVRAFPKGFESLICFEAFFGQDGDWRLPPEAERILEELQGADTPLYLSLVNDVQLDNGSFELKSLDFLKRHLLSPEARQSHVAQILELIRSTGVDGLEIDYENFKKDAQLWSAFSDFIGELYKTLSENGVRLRVVMEYGAPEYAVFPDGPIYICMCYNLHGSHSGPGPKADKAFLEKVGERWKTMPGEVHMALADGGYLWAGNNSEKSMTEQQAKDWLKEQDLTPVRDRESGVLWASVRSGQKYTVWYADGETLDFWRSILQSMGYTHFDLFRLGGNTVDSLALFLGKQ